MEALAQLAVDSMQRSFGVQASVLDGLSFDPFSFQQNGLAAPEADIGGREVI